MNSTSLFTNGARLVWRHQRILWWIFVVNLILAALIHHPVASAFGNVLDHSMASRSLVDSFNIGSWIELTNEDQIQMHLMWSYSMHFALVFLIYMVFINGGVLTVYHEDRKLPRAEFFEMSGAFFWRMVRLVLFSLIPLAILLAIFGAINDASDKMSSDAPNARTGFYVLLIGGIVMWIVGLFVRLWFDMAQSLTVAQNERGMLRMTWRGLVESFRGFLPLLSTYLSIHIVGLLAAMLFCAVWLFMPHARYVLSFVLLELLLIVEIAVRLWQKAACMAYVDSRSAVISTSSYELSPFAPLPDTPMPEPPATPPIDPNPSVPPPEV